MVPFAIELVLCFLGIRGHIPRFDDFHPEPAAPVTVAGHLARVLTVVAIVFAALSLAVWGTVWLAIQLL